MTAPFGISESEHGGVEAAQGAQDQEHVCVCCGVVDDCGDVGDTDAAFAAGCCVDLVVAGAWEVLALRFRDIYILVISRN